jgi:hypothetical protein
MGRTWIAAISLLAGSLTPTAAPSGAPSHLRDGVLEEQRAEAVAALLSSLEGLADWCNEKKLFLERDRCFEQILAFDPEHFRAHKGLGHSRLRDGTWVPPEGKKEPKNYDRKALADLPAERAKRLQPFRERMLGLATSHAAELGTAGVDRIHGEILAVLPDDAEVRALRHEVRAGEEWLLAESVLGKERRATVKQVVRDALAAVPRAEPILPNPDEQRLRVAWKSCLRTPSVRVLSTGDSDDALRVLQATHAAAGVFSALLGVEAVHPEGLTIYVLANAGEEQAFLAAHPAVDEATRPFLLTLEGAGLPGSANAVFWSKQAAVRLDGATRHVLSQLLQSVFGIGVEVGWVYEGLGLYLTRELVGTRLTWYVVPGLSSTDYEKNLRAKLLGSETNWMNEAWELLKSERRPELSKLLSRDVNAMTVDDVLTAYALVAYSIEGRPEAVAALLRGCATDGEPAAIVRQSLGMELEELTSRLTRWLGERR